MESDSSPDVDKAVQADERTNLLSHGKQCGDDSVSGAQKVPPRIARRLCLSFPLNLELPRVRVRCRFVPRQDLPGHIASYIDLRFCT